MSQYKKCCRQGCEVKCLRTLKSGDEGYVKMRKCSACRCTYYCSEECHRLDWNDVTYSHRDWCKAQQEFVQEVRNTSKESEENIQEIIFERACIHQLVTRNLIYNTNDVTDKWYAKGIRTKSSYLPPGVLMIKFESYECLESFVETGDSSLFFRMWYPAPRGNPYKIKIGGLSTKYMHTLRRNLKLAMNSPDVVPNPIMLLILVESKWQYNRFYVFWIAQKEDGAEKENLICVDDDTGVLVEKGNSLVFSSTERRPIEDIGSRST